MPCASSRKNAASRFRARGNARPEERKENQQRAALVEMHREAQSFFVKQLETTAEGKAARAYLEDRGLDAEAIARFGIGYAPSGGDALLRYLKQKYAEKLMEESGLVSRDQSGRLFDRFRRRITFPIANESGKVIAFGGRALGDDLPKYLNSPETPIYSKSNVLYHFDRAKEPSAGRISRFSWKATWIPLPWRARESPTWSPVAARAWPSRR